ncbi:MAG: hypothetical protein IPM29_24380 [Planctomycetes bacterium]|nr:hypothetical protein [Planctomycetota bacterium]
MPHPIRSMTALLAALLLAGSAVAQGDPPAPQQQLDALLKQLGEVSPEAWEQRLQAMRKAIEDAQRRAAELRAEAKRLTDEAAKRDAEAAALAAELEKVTQLRALLEKLKFRDPTPAAAPGSTAPPAPAMPAAPAAPAAPPGPPTAPSNAPAASTPAPAVPDTAAPMTAPTAAATTDGKADAERLLTFDDHVFPIFEDNCTVCHDAVDREGGLDLTSFAAAMQGGGSGRTFRAGDPDASRLYRLVSHQERPTMPPDEPRIAAEKIEMIRLWIAQGMPENAAHAKRLAEERAAREAAARSAAAQATAGVAAAVMPESVPPLDKVVPEHAPVLRAIAASPSAPLLAIPGQGQVLLCGRDEPYAELAILPFPFGQVRTLRFTADGARLLAAGGRPGQVGGAVVYDVRSGRELGRYGEQKDEVLAAGIAPDGSRVAVGGTRRRVEVFDAGDGARLFAVEHEEWVTAVDYSADGALLASADRAGLVRVTEAATGREAHALRGHEGAVWALAFRPDGALLVTTGADRRVMGFRMRDGERAFNEQRHGADVLAVAFCGAERFVTGDAQGQLAVWEASGKHLRTAPVATDWVYALATDPAADRAFAVDWSATLTAVALPALTVASRLTPYLARD